jgi:hypothetical protein
MSNGDTLKEEGLISIFAMDRDGTWHTIEVPGDLGLNVMEACKASDLPWKASVAGMGLLRTMPCQFLRRS